MKTAILCLTVAFVAFMGGVTYSCQNMNQLYYNALNTCTAAHGTWVPRPNSDGMCVYPH